MRLRVTASPYAFYDHISQKAYGDAVTLSRINSKYLDVFS